MNGLYIHIPFCVQKCPYCDFYSLGGQSDLTKVAYTDALIRSMEPHRGTAFDTVYFGGGTPPLLGMENLCRVLEAVDRLFTLENPEITLECNPESTPVSLLREVKAAGVNRLSAGLQSADPGELLFLGRRHSASQAAELILAAEREGIRNLSLDLMAALPGQTEETLRKSVAFCAGLPITHLSGYLLKVEPDTPFGRQGVSPAEDDRSADLYLTLCEACEEVGFAQYEISNFARPGFESRHNVKYWRLDPYLGLGPGAHSFWGGQRFFYPRSLSGFLENPLRTEEDGPGGNPEEYLMLGLRLAEGVSSDEVCRRFGTVPDEVNKLLNPLEKAGLLRRTEKGFALTRQGFLVSNGVIVNLLEGLSRP